MSWAACVRPASSRIRLDSAPPFRSFACRLESAPPRLVARNAPLDQFLEQAHATLGILDFCPFRFGGTWATTRRVGTRAPTQRPSPLRAALLSA
jgi:hypothetical protein